MKKIIAIFLLVSSAGALFAQQPAGTEPRDSQPIVVGGDQGGPQSTTTVRTVSTKKAYTQTVTVPETVTTVSSPDKIYVSESLLTWLSVGIRTSVDYHLTPKDTSVSCLWLYGEIHNSLWGIQAGVGYLWAPVINYTDAIGNSYTGTGTRGYINLDLIGKIYMPFAKWWWAGLGMNEAVLLGGQLKYFDNLTAAGSSNPAVANTAIARWVDITPGGGILYGQLGTGFKIAIGSGFNRVNFDPEFRALIPLNAPTGYGVVLRFNLGFSYAFGL